MSDEVKLTKLKHNWSFWMIKHEKAKSYEDNIKLIATVGSIEEFWRLLTF